MSIEVKQFPETIIEQPESVFDLERGIYMGSDGYYAITETISYQACVKVQLPFPKVTPAIFWKQDKLPLLLFSKIVSYFWHVYELQRTEAICHLYVAEHPRAPLDKKFKIIVQIEEGVSYSTVRGNPNARIPGYVFLGSVHSHGSMSAGHSQTDQESEKRINGLHIVVGDLNSTNGFSISAVISVNGERFHVSPDKVIDGLQKAHIPLSSDSIALSRVLRSRGRVLLTKPFVKPNPSNSDLVDVKPQSHISEVIAGPNLQLVNTNPQSLEVNVSEDKTAKSNTDTIPPIVTPNKVNQARTSVFGKIKTYWSELLANVGGSYTQKVSPNLGVSPSAEEGVPLVAETAIAPGIVEVKSPVVEVKKQAGIFLTSGNLENKPKFSYREEWFDGDRYQILFPLNGSYESIIPDPEWMESAKVSYSALMAMGENSMYRFSSSYRSGLFEGELTKLNLNGPMKEGELPIDNSQLVAKETENKVEEVSPKGVKIDQPGEEAK